MAAEVGVGADMVEVEVATAVEVVAAVSMAAVEEGAAGRTLAVAEVAEPILVVPPLVAHSAAQAPAEGVSPVIRWAACPAAQRAATWEAASIALPWGGRERVD